MKHVQPVSLQRPLTAQMDMDDNGSGGLLLKSILNFLLFGINPLFLLFFGAKTGGGNQNENGGSA